MTSEYFYWWGGTIEKAYIGSVCDLIGLYSGDLPETHPGLLNYCDREIMKDVTITKLDGGKVTIRTQEGVDLHFKAPWTEVFNAYDDTSKHGYQLGFEKLALAFPSHTPDPKQINTTIGDQCSTLLCDNEPITIIIDHNAGNPQVCNHCFEEYYWGDAECSYYDDPESPCAHIKNGSYKLEGHPLTTHNH